MFFLHILWSIVKIAFSSRTLCAIEQMYYDSPNDLTTQLFVTAVYWFIFPLNLKFILFGKRYFELFDVVHQSVLINIQVTV